MIALASIGVLYEVDGQLLSGALCGECSAKFIGRAGIQFFSIKRNAVPCNLCRELQRRKDEQCATTMTAPTSPVPPATPKRKTRGACV